MRQLPSSRDHDQSVEVEEGEARALRAFHAKAGLPQDLRERVGSEMTPVSNAAVEGRHRTAGHSHDQAASWLEVRHDATQQSLRLIDVLQYLRAHRCCRPPAQPGLDLRIVDQITLHERRAGDGDPCPFDAFAAQLDAHDRRVGKPAPQLRRHGSGPGPDVEYSLLAAPVERAQQLENQVPAVRLGRVLGVGLCIVRPMPVPVIWSFGHLRSFVG